jgi:eukaryotic-like serine/threonine-protein kinase
MNNEIGWDCIAIEEFLVTQHIDQTIGDYRILETIGSGGMGQVYLAENVHHKKRYAVKILPDQLGKDANFRKRFFDEARVMSELNHGGIVRVNHMGEYSGIYYLVMDYIEGPGGKSCSLHDKLNQSPHGCLNEEMALTCVSEICQALTYAHQMGIVHRDIKPANILLDKDGHFRITDFGLAKAIGAEFIVSQIHSTMASLSNQHTIASDTDRREDQDTLDVHKTTGSDNKASRGSSSSTGILGTYDYMSPEQREPRSIVDQRSDIYALGVMIYRMLTGKRPVGLAKPPSRAIKDLSPAWDTVVGTCLEEDPSERYQNVEALLQDLNLILAPEAKDTVDAVVGGDVGIGRPKEVQAQRVEVPQAIAPFNGDQACEYQRLTGEYLNIPADETIDLDSGVTLTMKLIPAGEFDMGNEEYGPVHRVHLTRPFYLGIYPVTQAQYHAVMGNNPSEFEDPDRPVERVTWHDAMKFCQKLGKTLGQEYRFPSEAEWEYACRAGTTTDFCFGDDERGLPDYGWHDNNSGGETCLVGQKLPNPFGLYDMHGNVWEWCQDWYDEYPSDSISDPPGAHSGEFRILRGGCWRYRTWYCRSAIRFWFRPYNPSYFLGFRLARTITD